MIVDFSSTVARVIVPVAVLAALTLLRKYLPAAAKGSPPAPVFTAEAEEFQRLQWVVGIAMVGVGIIFAYFTYHALLFANRRIAAADGPAQFELLPSKAIWWFVPGFGAICLAWETTLLLWSFFGDRNKIASYVQWTHERAGFNSTRALRCMALAIVLPIAVATCLAVPMHAILRENDMAIRQYASVRSRHYAYSQARRLMVVDGIRDRSGRFNQRADIIIDFADGFRWHSEANRDFERAVDRNLLEFVREKTALPMESAQTEADLPTSLRPQ